jgi:FAD/FMN-containing dehydrogenase
MTPTSTNSLSISDLRSQFSGKIIGPGDTEYDDARSQFYPGRDHRPAAIIRVAHDEDVARAVRLARETGLALSIRSGGHSFAGHSVADGGIMIDLCTMKKLDIDVEGRTAWAETGLTAGEVTNAIGAHGLVLGFGDTGSVGVGGITLGGGVGFLVRKHGLTIDSLLAADIVTANGESLRADAATNADLFWAIRGGGGNFGIATRFQFQLHEAPQVVGGLLFLPATAESIAGFIALAEEAPEELSAIANIMPAPPMPFLAEEHHGKPLNMAMLLYAGDTEAGQKAIAPFRALAEPFADLVQPTTYAGFFHSMESGEEESGFPAAAAASRSLFMDAFDVDKAQAILQFLEASTAMMGVAQLRVLGGAYARVPNDATAYAHRDRRIMVNVAALYNDLDEAEAHERWAGEFAATLNNRDKDVYVNFLGEDGPERDRQAYPGGHWEKLRALKKKYDPENLFRLNHNIPPAK